MHGGSPAERLCKRGRRKDFPGLFVRPVRQDGYGGYVSIGKTGPACSALVGGEPTPDQGATNRFTTLLRTKMRIKPERSVVAEVWVRVYLLIIHSLLLTRPCDLGAGTRGLFD